MTVSGFSLGDICVDVFWQLDLGCIAAARELISLVSKPKGSLKPR
jgi:hypothetical protein